MKTLDGNPKSEIRNPNEIEERAGSDKRQGDHSKLVSLLALAAGAVAMPQTGHAAIIFTDMSANPVTVGENAFSSFSLNMPGTAQLGFDLVHRGRGTGTPTSFTSYRIVNVAQKAGYVGVKDNSHGFVVPLTQGKVWNQQAGNVFTGGVAAVATLSNHSPNGYDNMYLAFEFRDTTQGNALRYGWVEVSLSNGNLSTTAGPAATITGWAYDNTGAQIAMGDTGGVPEPSSMALLALGALTLGAKGVRSWREKRV